MPTLTLKKPAKVICFVGISGKPGDNGTVAPLSEKTLSGKVISQVEAKLRTIGEDSSFFRDNLVQNPPLHKGKLRYPSQSEMEFEWSLFEGRLSAMKSNVVILLGRIVADFFKGKRTIQIIECESPDLKFLKWVGKDQDGTIVLAVAHPSYVGVYARKSVGKYSEIISQTVSGCLQGIEA